MSPRPAGGWVRRRQRLARLLRPPRAAVGRPPGPHPAPLPKKKVGAPWARTVSCVLDPHLLAVALPSRHSVFPSNPPIPSSVLYSRRPLKHCMGTWGTPPPLLRWRASAPIPRPLAVGRQGMGPGRGRWRTWTRTPAAASAFGSSTAAPDRYNRHTATAVVFLSPTPHRLHVHNRVHLAANRSPHQGHAMAVPFFGNLFQRPNPWPVA